MRMRDMTSRLLLAGPCPTCGVAVGKGCVLHSGQPRNEPHLDRKLCAIEALESKRAPATGGRSISDQNMSKWVEVIERERNDHDNKNDEQRSGRRLRSDIGRTHCSGRGEQFFS